MAGFLIPFGRMLGEAGAGAAEGKTTQLNNRWLDLNNQLLQKQIQLGGVDPKLLYKNQLAESTKRSKNLEIGRSWMQRGMDPNFQRSNPQEALGWLQAGQALIGDGTGSLEDATQVGLNYRIRVPDLMDSLQRARYFSLVNPAVRPVPMMGPDGRTILGGINQPLDPYTGERAITPFGMPAPGGSTINYPPSGSELPPPMAPPAPPTGAAAPAAAAPAVGAPAPVPALEARTDEVMRNVLRKRGMSEPEIDAEIAKSKTPGGVSVAAPATGPPAPVRAVPAAPATSAVPPAGGVAKIPEPPSPDVAVRTAKEPLVPRAWGNTLDHPLNAYARPPLNSSDQGALFALNNVLRQTDTLYRMVRAVPPSQRKGTPGAMWDWIKLKGHISSGSSADAVMSQIGATMTSLIAGFQSAGKTRAIAAIKMVDDHFPKLGDSYDLVLHKLEQLIRPDGYLTFARNSIQWGPTAAGSMNPIDEPLVAPPGAVWDAQQRWKFKSGRKGMMLDGIPYWQDDDGYWVQSGVRSANPR